MLNRWDPFAEIARLQDQMARWSGNSKRETESYGNVFSPPVDIFEDKDAIFVKTELPGLRAEDVQIHVENDVLTLKGERKLEREDNREGYRRIEREYGTFTRSFSIPKTMDTDRIEAEMKDGILTLRIPKKAAPEPKRIQVSSGESKNKVKGEPS